MKLSVVVPNYNGDGILKRNLPRVIEAALFFNKDSEMVVVDDASEDSSLAVLEEIKKRYEKNIEITIIKSEQNEGFSSSVNKGVSASRGEFVALLNTDVNPHKDFLAPLLENFNEDSVFGIGCLDESMEEGKLVPRGRGVGKWEKGFLVHRAGDLNKKSTLWVSGGSGVFRKSIWNKLGGLDQTYNPFYWEDIDICYRAIKSGYKVLFEKESRVVHEHEKGAIRSKYSHSDIRKIAYRNQFIFVWKNSDLINLVHHLFWLPYHLLNAILRLDREFLLGFVYAILKLPSIKRAEAQKLFVKSDNDVIESSSK